MCYNFNLNLLLSNNYILFLYVGYHSVVILNQSVFICDYPSKYLCNCCICKKKTDEKI